jgi:hypothetical protein
MSDLTAPRSWEGVILRVVRTPDGGGALEMWNPRARAWEPSNLGDKFLASPIATNEDLKAAGLPYPWADP